MKINRNVNFTALALGLLLFSQLLFWPWSAWITRKLIDVPLSLSQPVAVAQDIYVPIQESYELSFVFPRYPHGTEDMRAFLDGEGYFEGRWSASGAPIPIRWLLTNSKDGHIVASGVTNASHASGWSNTLVWRHVAYIKAPPGHYRFQAKVLQSVLDLRNTAPRLTLALSGGKEAATWQLSLVFWGTIVSTLAVLPLGAILLIVLLWRWARPGNSFKPKSLRGSA